MTVGGFFTGVMVPSRDLLVRESTPPGSFGKVFGFVTNGFNVSGVVAPLIFGSDGSRRAAPGVPGGDLPAVRARRPQRPARRSRVTRPAQRGGPLNDREKRGSRTPSKPLPSVRIQAPHPSVRIQAAGGRREAAGSMAAE